MAILASLIPSESYFFIILVALIFIGALIASIPDKGGH